MFRYKYSIILIFFICFSNIFAQESTPRIITVEENICVTFGGRDGAEYLIIKNTAEKDNIEAKLLSIEYIRDIQTRNSTIITINDVFDILMALAFEGTVITKRDDGIIVCNFPNVRLEAVRLIGELKIIEARMALIEVLRHENDMLIIHEAIRGLLRNWSNTLNDEENNIINVFINRME